MIGATASIEVVTPPFDHLHPILTTLIHEKGRIPREAVVITFDRPNRDVINAPTEPTINLFAMATHEETSMRVRGHEVHTNASNRKQTRELPCYVNITYVAYVLTGGFADECDLHWRLRTALMQHNLLAQRLKEGLALAEGVSVKASLDEQDVWRKSLDFWNALGLPPRPTLFFTVTVPLDLEITSEFRQVVTQVSVQTADDTTHLRNIAGRVRDAAGQPIVGVRVSWTGRLMDTCVTDALGQFTLLRVWLGAITLQAALPDGRTHTKDFDEAATRFVIDLK